MAARVTSPVRDAVRCVAAVPLDEAARGRLAAVVERLRGFGAAVGWVAPERMHVTLKFLGDVAPDRLTALRAALRAVPWVPFAMAIAGLGAFPARGRPRVVWAGIGTGAAELTALAARIDDAAAACGFAREDRPYHPHVTLGRVRGGDPRRLVAALAAGGEVAAPPAPAGGFALYRSERAPAGARYSVIEAFGA